MSDFNPDEFIAGLRTAKTTVTIFQATDVAGELLSVEEDLKLLPEPGEEQSLDAGAERAELLEKQERLRAELQDSAVDFTIRAMSQSRVDELAKIARKACKDRADQASKDAAEYAREECKRAEITDSKDIKEHVKNAASNASSRVIQNEAGAQLLSRAIVNDTDNPVFTVEQMREVVEQIGAQQVEKLQAAFYKLTNIDPAALVPKSSKPGSTDED